MKPFAGALVIHALFTLSLALPRFVQAAEPTAKPARPIQALLITGGCCHDYTRQKLILPKGISARANVVWTVVQQGGSGTDAMIPLYEDPNWAAGFDVVVHNECFAGVNDEAWVERILRPHREGVPAVLIHCAMHCYRTGNDNWFEFVGMQSPGHGAHYAYQVDNLRPDHPIMQGFGVNWTVPKGELYHSIKLWPTATVLAQAKRQGDNQPQTCVWTNQYGKARVFCTTIGHYNETMAEPKYLDLVTRGLLWAVGRESAKDFREATADDDAAVQGLVNAAIDSQAAPPSRACCGAGNLAHGKPAQADSEEAGKNNFAKNAVDGNLATRWCANNPDPGHAWQVDLEQPAHVRSLRIHWESTNNAYRYLVEASADGKSWKTIADASKNTQAGKFMAHDVDADEARYLRVTFLGSSAGGWGSIREFEAYDGPLPELPKGVSSDAANPATIADVKAPEGMNVTLFGTPPTVNYPVCLAAAATGEVFVGVDEQGSLGKEPGRGKVLRCIDVDGDGRADRVNTFAKMDHPRGLIYDNGSLWVLHPPTLSLFHDDDLDGVADRQETLVTGISTEEVAKRGADHTTNGIRMGIDGWIYIAVGDFGFTEARGTDGRTLSQRGGGIARVRPDGTELEIYAWNLRNVLDACIDPQMNLFTRDNTNDGGGWDVRLSHIMQSAQYGYPSHYMNFADETMPPLADYGGGSGCGGMYLHDLRWPAPHGDALYTCDWGRSEVYRHNLPADGATFTAHQETFLKLPRPTDIDVDGSGRMYVSSWKDGKFGYDGPNIGFVAQITPQDLVPKPFPNLSTAGDAELVEYLAHDSAVYRLHSQREILRRGKSTERTAAIVALAAKSDAPLYALAAAIFTLKQLDGADSNAALVKLAAEPATRELALRASTDRKSQLAGVPVELLIAALRDKNPRVQAQALVSLGRLGDAGAAESILPLTKRPADAPLPTGDRFHAQPDPARVLSHLAVRALVALDAVDACLAALDEPSALFAQGALQTLQYLHGDRAVDGLSRRLSTTNNPALRREIMAALVRLYHREGEYKTGWWGTRPDTSGPYFDRQNWEASDRIAQVLLTVAAEADPETLAHLHEQLARHKVAIDGLSADVAVSPNLEPEAPIALPQVDSSDKNLIANMSYDEAFQRTASHSGDPDLGKSLFTSQACIACHTYANGQLPKGPHLVDIGKRYKRAELIESVLKPSAKFAQGFDSYAFVTADGLVLTGFVTSESAHSVTIRDQTGLSKQIATGDIEERLKQPVSIMPAGLVNNLTPEQLADLLAYLESLH